MIRVSGLARRYGEVQALGGIDFSVARGEVVGFLGPNGAGKTTTLRILLGLVAPSAGRAFIDEHPVDDPRRDVRALIGYLPETSPIPGEVSVRRHLAFVARIQGLPRGRRRAAVDAALGRCGLEPVADRPVGQLSKGYRQRVGIAQAIVHEPPVLILDEPTSGLDPNQRVEIRALIRALSPDRTIIFSSHVLAEVEAVATRVIILHRGQVVADAPAAGLLAGQGLRVRVPDAQLDAALARVRAIEGVTGAHRAGEALHVDAAPAVAPAIARALEGLDLLELSPIRGDLEATFRRLTGAA